MTYCFLVDMLRGVLFLQKDVIYGEIRAKPEEGGSSSCSPRLLVFSPHVSKVSIVI